MNFYFDQLQFTEEMAFIASELRVLGFNESSIAKIIDIPKANPDDTFKMITAIHEMIRKYKDASDLYGASYE